MSTDVPPGKPAQPNIFGLLAGGLGAVVGLVLSRYAGMMLLIPCALAVAAGWLLFKIASEQHKPMVPAAGALAGHGLWILLGMVILKQFGLASLDVLLLLGGACWLVFAPSLTAVCVLSGYEVIGLIVNGVAFAQATRNTDVHKALLVHLALRLGTILLIFIGWPEVTRRKHGVAQDNAAPPVPAPPADPVKTAPAPSPLAPQLSRAYGSKPVVWIALGGLVLVVAGVVAALALWKSSPDSNEEVVVLDIKPPKMSAHGESRPLSGKLEDVAVGGGGRYFVFYYKTPKPRIEVFDINELRVVNQVEIDGGTVSLAAGLDKLMIYYPDPKLLQRWQLPGLKKEVDAIVPALDKARIAMGSASRGPLWLGDKFFDIQTLQPLSLTVAVTMAGRPFAKPDFELVTDTLGGRVSANGKVFARRRLRTSPQGCLSFSVAGGQLKGDYAHESRGYLCPGPDGKHIYSSQGIFRPDWQPAVQGTDSALPAHHGDQYLLLTKPSGNQFVVTVHRIGDSRTLETLDNVMLPATTPKDAEVFGRDKRIHYLPMAELLLIIPESNDQLQLYRVAVK